MPRIIGSHMLLSAGEQALAQCFAGCVVHAANSARHFMSNTAHYTRDSLSSAHCCASRERRAGRARSDMRELLEEAGTGLARELAADFFAGHARAVVHQSAAMRVLQAQRRRRGRCLQAVCGRQRGCHSQCRACCTSLTRVCCRHHVRVVSALPLMPGEKRWLRGMLVGVFG